MFSWLETGRLKPIATPVDMFTNKDIWDYGLPVGSLGLRSRKSPWLHHIWKSEKQNKKLWMTITHKTTASKIADSWSTTLAWSPETTSTAPFRAFLEPLSHPKWPTICDSLDIAPWYTMIHCGLNVLSQLFFPPYVICLSIQSNRIEST
jgi:hypothetical protein